MAIVSTEHLLQALNVQNGSDPNVLQRHDLLRKQVEAGIKSYLKWPVEQATVTEYYDGQGYCDLVLRKPFVTNVASVNLDPQGFYGQNPGGFASSTLLVQGTDWALVLEADGTLAKSGRVKRLTSNLWWFPSDFFYYRQAGGLAYWGPNTWPKGYGNVKVTYTYGFTTGTMPLDLQLAVETAVGLVRNSVRYGWPVTSESLGDYNYSLAIAREPEFGTVRQLLSTYRDLSISMGL